MIDRGRGNGESPLLGSRCAFLFDGNGEPESQCMQQCIETPEFRIAPFRKHSVQAFSIEFGLLGN